MSGCLVLYRGSLLAQGVVTLLKEGAMGKVVGSDLDRSDPIQAVRTLSPEVVIVDVEDLKGVSGRLLLSLLEEMPNLKVICLDSAENRAHLLYHEGKVVLGSKDLTNLLLKPESKKRR